MKLRHSCKRFNVTNKPMFLLIILMLGSYPACVYAASLAKVTLAANSALPIYFESNAAFWDPSWADPGTALVRIPETTSINGDGNAWQLTLADNPGSGQKFSFIAWALDHLNASTVSHLVLYVRGGSGGETFEVGLKDFTNPAQIRVNAVPFIVGGGAVTTNYKQIRIPLTEFSSRGVILSDLDIFVIISTAPDGQNITLYLDAMRFE